MTSPSPGAFAPVWCTQLELGDPVPDTLVPPHSGFTRARVLVRVHDEPIGYLRTDVPTGGIASAELVQRAATELSEPLRQHLVEEGTTGAHGLRPPLERRAGCPSDVQDQPQVTVVVCTRDRASVLEGCLRHLTRLTYPSLEIVVVDNAPPDDATKAVFSRVVGDDARFRYVTEPAPGLSRARNRGLAEATGSLLAYTDDDVTVDPSWIEGVVRGFSRGADVGCVTGLVCTASIDSPQEAYFDARVTWASSTVRRTYDLAHRPGDDALFPYSPGIFGTGANFAFRTQALRAIGGFDEALGAGSLTRGGEDLDVFVRVLQAGHALAYEPASVVWHHHRADLEGMRKQMFAYGTGLTAFLAKHLADGRTRRQVLRRIPLGVRKLAAVKGTTEVALGPDVPVDRSALLRELAGFAAGPVLYARARRRLRPVAPAR